MSQQGRILNNKAGCLALFNLRSPTKQSAGFVLVEMLMVVGLIAIMTGIAMVSFGGMWGNLRFKRQADELVNVFQMAYNTAAESDRRYAVILDFLEQSFTLREFKSLDLETMNPDEAIVQTGNFSEETLRLERVVYDDVLYNAKDSVLTAEEAEDTSVAEARFLAGHSGWQNGGIVIISDQDGMPWTIVIHRLAKPVELLEGEWDLDSLGMNPREERDVPF